MKLNLRKFLLLCIAVLPFTIWGANPTKYFEELSIKPNYNYNYVSPIMLKAMGDMYISSDTSANLPVKSSDITSIENISTLVNGQDDDLWDIISKIKKDKGLETLTTKRKDNYRYDVLAHLSKDGKNILQLLVVTQNGGNCVDVIYMEGKIPMERLKYSFSEQ